VRRNNVNQSFQKAGICKAHTLQKGDFTVTYLEAESTEESLTAPPSTPGPISFWEAFIFWLKLGFISFSDPAGQIAIMHQELVERRRW
jgi:hypothetical protein